MPGASCGDEWTGHLTTQAWGDTKIERWRFAYSLLMTRFAY